jgi:hypothetical protein
LFIGRAGAQRRSSWPWPRCQPGASLAGADHHPRDRRRQQRFSTAAMLGTRVLRSGAAPARGWWFAARIEL